MRWMLLVLLFPLGLAAQLPDFTSLVREEGAAAGLYPGDIILSVNAQSTRTPQAFAAAVGKALPGEALALLVTRDGSRAFVPLRIP